MYQCLEAQMKLRSALIKLYSGLFGTQTKLVSDRTYVRTLYALSFGKKPDLTKPRTFNEHICRIKLSDDCLKYAAYTDKYAVRAYVASTIGEAYLTPIYGVFDSVSQIDFAQLPQQFALKATHASGYNLIVTDKDTFDASAAQRQFERWLSVNYYLVGREKNYKNIKPRILAEQYIPFAKPLTEYKLFCFHGLVRMIAVHRFYENTRTATVYTPAWERLDVKLGYPNEASVPKPDSLQELISCAQKLSAPFDFVRVDMYADGTQVRFSELTFTPGGGLVHITPPDFAETMGSWFD